MNESDLQKLCELFELGEIISKERVFGGLLHKMWKVETNRGIYAVKELNQEILGREGIRENIEYTEKIAKQAEASGILVSSALISKNGFTIETCGNTFFMAYKWINGEVLPASAVNEKQARQMGSLLGKLHSLDFSQGNIPKSEIHIFSQEHWKNLLQKSSEIEIIFEENLLEKLEKWSQIYKHAAEVLKSDLVLSHRDIDQKNVIWRNEDGLPVLIDWESVGFINPITELLRMALDFSGFHTGKIEKDIFDEVISGYFLETKKPQEEICLGLQACFGSLLEWFEYNLQRCVQTDVFDEDEQEIGKTEVLKTLKMFHVLEGFLLN